MEGAIRYRDPIPLEELLMGGSFLLVVGVVCPAELGVDWCCLEKISCNCTDWVALKEHPVVVAMRADT